MLGIDDRRTLALITNALDRVWRASRAANGQRLERKGLDLRSVR